MCRLHHFVLDSRLATLWECNCPFGFLLVMFPLGSSYFVFVCLSFHVSDERCGIIVSIPDHCLPFYFKDMSINKNMKGLKYMSINKNMKGLKYMSINKNMKGLKNMSVNKNMKGLKDMSINRNMKGLKP